MNQMTQLRIPFDWEERRPIQLEQFFYVPRHYERHDEWKINPFFENENPIVIEYCSGNGQWIVDLAKKNPQKNFIAVEMKFHRAQKIWKGAQREHLSNLMVVCSEALTFTKYYLPRASISEIYVNFPDPWPKLRHAKHRLIRNAFLVELERVILKDVKILFTTDDFTYLQQMMREVETLKKWQPRFKAPFYQVNLPDFGDSYFRNLWQAKGKQIYHLAYEVQL